MYTRSPVYRLATMTRHYFTPPPFVKGFFEKVSYH